MRRRWQVKTAHSVCLASSPERCGAKGIRHFLPMRALLRLSARSSRWWQLKADAQRLRSAAAEGGRLEQWVSPMLTDRERVAIFHFFRVLRMPSRRPAHINPTPKTVPAHLACSPDNQTTAASRMFGSADFADCPPLGSSPLPALQAATSIRPKKNSGGPILLWLTNESKPPAEGGSA